MDEIINGVNQSPNITLDTTDTTAIQAAAQAALVADNLDHLALTTDGVNNYPNLVAAGTILAKIISKAAAGATPTGYNCTTDSLEAIADAVGAIPTTAMRGTDSAFLASVGGALDSAAATGAVSDAKVAMAYIKQIVNNVDASLYPAAAVCFKTTTIDLNQAAASYDLATGTTQAVVVEGLAIQLPNVDVSDDATITSISIQTDDVTPSTFISTTSGAKANLTAENQLGFTGFTRVAVGTKIQLTIAGGASDAATVCNVNIMYRPLVAGGYLA